MAPAKGGSYSGTLSVTGGTVTTAGSIAHGATGHTTVSSGPLTASAAGSYAGATEGALSVSASGGSWTSDAPPVALIAASPAVPSSSDPERTTPMTRAPCARAALRNRGSTAGRCPFSCGPFTERIVRRLMSRWRPGGAT